MVLKQKQCSDGWKSKETTQRLKESNKSTGDVRKLAVEATSIHTFEVVWLV